MKFSPVQLTLDFCPPVQLPLNNFLLDNCPQATALYKIPQKTVISQPFAPAQLSLNNSPDDNYSKIVTRK